MQLSLYQTIGPQHIKQLIHDFYQGVQTDQLLIPMYRDGFAVAEDRLHLFMIQYLGGPTTYSDQRRNQDSLASAHEPCPRLIGNVG